MGSIFQNLPNNLIMNIIKMETDRANEEKNRLALSESKNKFKDCINQMTEIEKYVGKYTPSYTRDFYYSDALADYIEENGTLYFGFMLCDLFSKIEDSNEGTHNLELEDSDDDNNMFGGQMFENSDDE